MKQKKKKDLTKDLVAKKICYCSKADLVGDIDRDIVGDLVAIFVLYYSKTAKRL
jgi:hypothetical protein